MDGLPKIGLPDYLQQDFVAMDGPAMFRPESIMLKVCLKCFQEFPKNLPYYAQEIADYA